MKVKLVNEWENVPFKNKKQERKAVSDQASSVNSHLYRIVDRFDSLGYERIYGTNIPPEPNGWPEYVITRPENARQIRADLEKYRRLEKRFDNLMKRCKQLDREMERHESK